LAVAFALGSPLHAVTYAIGSNRFFQSGMLRLIAMILPCNIVVFGCLTRALFDDESKMRWWACAGRAAVPGFLVINCCWIAPASAGERAASLIAINLLVLGFIACRGPAVASWPADLVEGRRRLGFSSSATQHFTAAPMQSCRY